MPFFLGFYQQSTKVTNIKINVLSSGVDYQAGCISKPLARYIQNTKIQENANEQKRELK